MSLTPKKQILLYNNSMVGMSEAGSQTSGGVLEVWQREVERRFPGRGVDLCPFSHRDTAAVIRLAMTHRHRAQRLK